MDYNIFQADTHGAKECAMMLACIRALQRIGPVCIIVDKGGPLGREGGRVLQTMGSMPNRTINPTLGCVREELLL